MAQMRGRQLDRSRDDLMRIVESYSQRNEALVSLITSLRQSNSDLRASLNIMNQKLFFRHSRMIDKSTQTDVIFDHFFESSKQSRGESHWKDRMHDRNRSVNVELDADFAIFTTPIKGNNENAVDLEPFERKSITPIKQSEKAKLEMKRKSPVKERVRKILVERSVNIPQTARTGRNIKKPISYREPSLHVKVRKGFEFFKFTENDET